MLLYYLYWYCTTSKVLLYKYFMLNTFTNILFRFKIIPRCLNYIYLLERGKIVSKHHLNLVMLKDTARNKTPQGVRIAKGIIASQILLKNMCLQGIFPKIFYWMKYFLYDMFSRKRFFLPFSLERGDVSIKYFCFSPLIKFMTVFIKKIVKNDC